MGRRGNKKHLKRLAAPKQWMLDKLSGVWAPRPGTGPHKLRECLPLVLVLRNRLKYALTGTEVKKILMQRLIKVDGKVRLDPKYPAGFMDVITIDRTAENFRVLYDVKGRFKLVKLESSEQAKMKLCKVVKAQLGRGGIPYIATHDGRTIRYPDPTIKVGDSVKFDLQSQKVTDFFKLDQGATVMITKGRNTGRVGQVMRIERHPGSTDIVHIKDDTGKSFATRKVNAFVVGVEEAVVTLPKHKGVKKTILEERSTRLNRARRY